MKQFTANFTISTMFSFLNQKSYSSKVSYCQSFYVSEEEVVLIKEVKPPCFNVVI